MNTLIIVVCCTMFVVGALARVAVRLVRQDVLTLEDAVNKLILSNNTQRALRLLSGAQRNFMGDTPLNKALHSLLLVAHRPHMLELYYQAGAQSLEMRLVRRGLYAANIANAGSSILLAAVWYGNKSPWWALALAILGVALSTGAASAHRMYLRECLGSLTRTRNMLYAYAKYVPPVYKPREMNAAELAEWKTRMEALEKEAAETGADPTNLHDERVDKETGVLPPLP